MSQKSSSPRKILLTNPRRDQSSSPASAALEPVLRQTFGAQLERLDQLDKAIEAAHSLIGELMAGAKTAVGVEWIPHKTRPGLHPAVHKRKHTLRNAVWLDGSPRRLWATVVNHSYLQRHQDCMEGQEQRLIGPLTQAFHCLIKLLDERERLLDTLGEIRRQLTARKSALQGAEDPVLLLAGLERQTAGLRALP
jgi:hypothetical protein